MADIPLKTENPYQPPGEEYRAAVEPGPSLWTRLPLAMTGLYLGLLGGAISGFIGGAELGLTFRLVHQSDILSISPPFRWFFESISTPLDFALYHGTLVLFPLGVLGGILGFLEGDRIARLRHNNVGRLCFAIGGVVVGLMNGVSATGGERFVIPYLIEGPIAGCFFGGANALIAWHLYGKCMNAIVRRPGQWQVKFFLLASLAISVCVFAVCAVIATSGSAPLLLQVVARFTAILSLAASCTIAFFLRRLHLAEPT